MNKIISLLFILTLTTLIACSKQQPSQSGNDAPTTLPEASTEIETDTNIKTDMDTDNTAITSNSDYVDLTSLSSTMVYAEVYNMMMQPSTYVGKTIKMMGEFTVFEDSETGATYTACLIYDATACCQQGIEFVLGGDLKYPEDYPAVGDEICVEGIFETYLEGEFTYCHLVDATLVSN